MGYFTSEYDELSTKNKISLLESELNLQYAQKRQNEENSEVTVEADTNAFDAMFDGIKGVFTQENAILFKSPMRCIANAFYKTVENDGLKDIVNYYVCMPLDPSVKTMMVDEKNFSDYMEPWDLA